MVVEQHKDSVTYRTCCACGDFEHDVTIDFEFDKKWNLADMVFYKKVSVRSYTSGNYEFRPFVKEVLKFVRLKESYIDTIDWGLVGFESFLDRVKDYTKRVKLAFRILFTGYVEMDEGFTFKGADHVKVVIAAMQEGLVYLERPDDETELQETEKGEAT